MGISIQELRELIKSDDILALDKNKNYLYHGIFIPGFEDISPVLSILEHGVLSVSKLKKIGIEVEQIHTSNGKYYICLSSNKNEFDRIFDIGFIVENGSNYIKADNDSKLAKLLWNTPFPLRSGLKDEYQIRGKIDPEQIIAIQLRFDKMLSGLPDYMKISEEEYVARIIKGVNAIFDKIEEKGYTIPVINADNNQIISKELFRRLQESENISTLFAGILKEIPNVGDIYVTSEPIPCEYDSLLEALGCSIKRMDGDEKTFITRTKPKKELEHSNLSEITHKTNYP